MFYLKDLLPGTFSIFRKFDGIDDGNDNVDFRFKRIRLNDELDTRFGYVTYKESAIKIAWLLNMHPVKF